MMILDKACARDGALKVGVESTVWNCQSEACHFAPILRSGEHRKGFIDGFQSQIGIVGDMKTIARAFLRRHLYDARSSTRTVGGGLCCVFQDGETLNVSGEDTIERGEVAIYPIDNHQGIVTAR